MSVQKSREQSLWDCAEEFRRMYRPVAITMMIKEEFLEIMKVDERSFIDGKTQSFFSERDWYDFCARLIEAFTTENQDILIAKYFKSASSFEFEISQNQNVHIFQWWLKSGAPGNQLFDKPGSVMMRDVDMYWVIAFFSNEEFTKKDYSSAENALEDMITTLENSG